MNTENWIYISSFIFIQASIFSLIYLVEMDQKHAQVQTDNCAKNCQFGSQNFFSHTYFHGTWSSVMWRSVFPHGLWLSGNRIIWDSC